VAGTTRGRLVQINQVVLDQADFFLSDGFTRVLGITATSGAVTHNVFFDNVEQPWPLVDGTTVQDAAVSSGQIYWNEIASEPGHYSVRLRPNAVGYWRLLITYPAGTQIVVQDYDVTAKAPITAGGLKASFVK